MWVQMYKTQVRGRGRATCQAEGLTEGACLPQDMFSHWSAQKKPFITMSVSKLRSFLLKSQLGLVVGI